MGERFRIGSDGDLKRRRDKSPAPLPGWSIDKLFLCPAAVPIYTAAKTRIERTIITIILSVPTYTCAIPALKPISLFCPTFAVSKENLNLVKPSGCPDGDFRLPS